MRCVLATLGAILALASPALAQPHVPAVTVLPDRVLTGHGNAEFVPRFVTFLPDTLAVPAGQTITIAGAVTKDAIEVAGTLRCSGPLTLRVTHLTILPGGLFDCQQTATLVIRDVPIDTARDPYRFGNGLINMGRVVLGKDFKPAFTTLTSDAQAGATTVALAVPAEWQVGDELLLPDMRQANFEFWFSERREPRREARVFIAAKTATSLTLSKPLDFEHLSILDASGAVVLRPRIANLSRSFVILSERADGTRGHTIMLGPQASWQIVGVEFADLGRTTVDVLDSTTADASGAITRIGTNQIGRYAGHAHMVGNATGSIVRGSSFVDTHRGKVAWATHMTEGVVIEDTIAVGFAGTGFATEDGPERNNRFTRVVAAYTKAPSLGDYGVSGRLRGAKAVLLEGRSFADQSGFWNRGMANDYDVESWNNAIGFQLLYLQQVKSPDFDVLKAVPTSLKLVAIGNMFSGLEAWNAPPAFLGGGEGIDLAHNGMAVHTGSAEFGNFLVKNLRVLCAPGKARGLDSSHAYINVVTVEGGFIKGCTEGLHDAVQMTVRDLTLQNVVNINRTEAVRGTLLAENVTGVSLPGFPVKHVTFSTSPWQHGQPLPTTTAWYEWTPASGSRTVLKNWNLSGRDYYLYTTDQLRDKHAMASPNNAGAWMWAPEAGLTLGETWDRWGIAIGGGTVAQADTVPFPGLVNGVARVDADTPLGPPRAILNAPNRIAPAGVSDGRVLLWFTPSGRPAGTSYGIFFQIDGGPILRAVDTGRGLPFGSVAAVSAATIPDGIRTVTTWRESSTGQRMLDTQMQFTFQMGTGTPPPPVDCVVSAWSEWSACVNGTQTRTRTVLTPASNGGLACPALAEVRSCTVAPPCTAGAFGDVVVSGKTYRVTVDAQCLPSVVGPL